MSDNFEIITKTNIKKKKNLQSNNFFKLNGNQIYVHFLNFVITVMKSTGWPLENPPEK